MEDEKACFVQNHFTTYVSDDENLDTLNSFRSDTVTKKLQDLLKVSIKEIHNDKTSQLQRKEKKLRILIVDD